MAKYEEPSLIAACRLAWRLARRGIVDQETAGRIVASVTYDGCTEAQWAELASNKRSYFRGRAGLYLHLMSQRLPIYRDNGNWLMVEGAQEAE